MLPVHLYDNKEQKNGNQDGDSIFKALDV